MWKKEEKGKSERIITLWLFALSVSQFRISDKTDPEKEEDFYVNDDDRDYSLSARKYMVCVVLQVFSSTLETGKTGHDR